MAFFLALTVAKFSVSVLLRYERVTIASTASVATLANFRFREPLAPKRKNCLLG